MTLLNSHLSTTQLWFVAGNGAGALCACIVNVLAYRRTGHGGSRYTYAIVAALSALYVASYAALGFTELLPIQWSNTMRGVSMLTWPTVWTMHAAAKVWSKQSERWGEAVIEVVKARLVDDPSIVSDL